MPRPMHNPVGEKKKEKRALYQKLRLERKEKNAELLKDGITNEIWIIKKGSYLEKIENTAPIVQNTAPIAQNTAPIAQNTAPIAQNTAPIVQDTAPIADPMSSPDDYVSPLMGSRKPDPAAAAKPFTLPSQFKKAPKPQVQTSYSVFKVDPSWPKQLVEKFSNNHCTLCNVKMTSQQTAKAHYDGKQHKKKINAFILNHGSSTGETKTEEKEEKETNDTSNAATQMNDTSNASTEMNDTSDATTQMNDTSKAATPLIRPDTSTSWKPIGPELNPHNFALDCTGLPDMHIHSDGSIEGTANSQASKEDIAKISCCLIKYILKECLKAKRNKEKEKSKPKKRKADGEEVDDDKNAIGRIEGRHCRIGHYSLILNKEIWLGRKKIAKSVATRPELKETPLQREFNITEHQISMAENNRVNIGGGLTLYFDIHIWQNIEEPHRILVTGDPSGSASVQTAMMKPMYAFFASMSNSLLRGAMHWVKNQSSKKK